MIRWAHDTRWCRRSGHGSSAHNSGVSNVSRHGSSIHNSDVSSDVSVNASTGLADFNDFLDDPEVANYNKIQHFEERYLSLQNSINLLERNQP